MLSRITKVFVAFLCCLSALAVVSTRTTLAVTPEEIESEVASGENEDLLDDFAENNIIYYDPTEHKPKTCAGASANSDSGLVLGANSTLNANVVLGKGGLGDKFGLNNNTTTVNVGGSTIEEKIWNGLRSLGVSDAVAAGILGNMYYESSLNPARHEKSKKNKYWPMALNEHKDISYGLGLIQWSFGRRIKLYNYVAEQFPGLEQTFLNHPETYSTSPTINGTQFFETAKANNLSTEADKLLAVELDFLINKEMRVYNSYKKVFDETTVKGAAQQFSIRVEGCSNCRDVNNQSVKNRVAKAEEFYNKLKNSSGSISSPIGIGNLGTQFQLTTGSGAEYCPLNPGSGDEGGGSDDTGSGGSDNPYGEGGYQGDDYTYTGDVASLQHLVKEWAWGTHYKKAGRPIAEQTAAYRNHKPKYGGCQGNDCGGFVADTIKTSGWDPNFKYQGVRYMQDTLWSSSTWKEVTSQISGDGDMKPGDIIICSHNSKHHSKKCGEGNIGHVMLWVGSISGFSSKIASASYNNNGNPCSGTRAPSASESAGNIMHHIRDSGYSIYRKVK